MSMTVHNNLYSNYASINANTNIKNKEVNKNRETQQKTLNQPNLSSTAKNLLKDLRKTYGDQMEFMIYDKGQDPKELLSKSTKEFSVVLSADELERMASDKKFEQEYMNGVRGAIRMSNEINQKFGYGSAFGQKNNNSQITKIGISFDKNSIVTYFAELEKSSSKIREHAEKKEKENLRNNLMQKTFIEANSAEELIKKISNIDWNKVPEIYESKGSIFNISA